jgi:pimeloyl-ACP methyl ester carboxylesterase
MDDFKSFSQAVSEMMSTQPNYRAADLREIRLPVAIVHSEHEEFIRREHAEYLARTLPQAELHVLPGVTHFAPLQRPEMFNSLLFEFLAAMPSTA